MKAQQPQWPGKATGKFFGKCIVDVANTTTATRVVSFFGARGTKVQSSALFAPERCARMGVLMRHLTPFCGVGAKQSFFLFRTGSVPSLLLRVVVALLAAWHLVCVVFL
jgi:hypothetical protein